MRTAAGHSLPVHLDNVVSALVNQAGSLETAKIKQVELAHQPYTMSSSGRLLTIFWVSRLTVTTR